MPTTNLQDSGLAGEPYSLHDVVVPGVHPATVESCPAGYVAQVKDRPETAQTAPSAHMAWSLLRSSVGVVAPADPASAKLIGWGFYVGTLDVG